jgi:uncharacterized protein (DUF305 family)
LVPIVIIITIFFGEKSKLRFVKSLFPITLVVAFLLESAPLFAQHDHGNHHQFHTPSAVTDTSANTDFSELEALYWKRKHESRQHFVQADVDFMTDMIVHHAQALIMSRLSPENGASASVQRLSARIINAQQDEIALMQQWLRDRGQPVPIVHFAGLDLHVSMEMPEKGTSNGHHEHHVMEHSDHPDLHSGHNGHKGHEGHVSQKLNSNTDAHSEATKVEQNGAHDGYQMSHNQHDHHGHNHDDMVGMLSQAQMEELAAAQGSEFDRLFLTYMIEHHEGAVYMVNELFSADGAGTDLDSYRLAVDIYAEQVTEIAMMRGMLDRKGFPVPEPLQELREQQERLRNPGAGNAGHQNHSNHKPSETNSGASNHHH